MKPTFEKILIQQKDEVKMIVRNFALLFVSFLIAFSAFSDTKIVNEIEKLHKIVTIQQSQIMILRMSLEQSKTEQSNLKERLDNFKAKIINGEVICGRAKLVDKTKTTTITPISEGLDDSILRWKRANRPIVTSESWFDGNDGSVSCGDYCSSLKRYRYCLSAKKTSDSEAIYKELGCNFVPQPKYPLSCKCGFLIINSRRDIPDFPFPNTFPPSPNPLTD